MRNLVIWCNLVFAVNNVNMKFNNLSHIHGFLISGIQKNVKMHVQTLDIIVFYSSDGFEGDLLLWVKMLLPGVNKRVYNLQSKQLIKLFSQVKIKHGCACKSILKKSAWLKNW